MELTKTLHMTREKHLDHMVRVVPFIVFCYAIQCYFIMKISPTEFSSISLSILGGFLAAMISCFITYDLKHQAKFSENEVEIHFLGSKKIISYSEIVMIDIKEPGQSFSTLILKTNSGKYSFYFIDDAEKIKKHIESQKHVELLAA